MKMTLYSIGLMSGTSMDGVDAVLLKTTVKGDRFVHHVHRPYPKTLRQSLLQMIKDPQSHLHNIGILDNALGKHFAATAKVSSVKPSKTCLASQEKHRQ